MSRPVIGWCADCFRELHRGLVLWTRGQDEDGSQVLVCNACAKLDAADDYGHYTTCPFRGDQRLALPA